MKTSLQAAAALLAFGLAVTACGNKDSAEPDPARAGQTPPANKPASTAGGAQFAASPSPSGTGNAQAPQPGPAAQPQKGYPRDAIKTIPDNCASPLALLVTAPEKVGDSYAWPTSRQAFLANQQFRVTSGDPAVPGEVQLATYKYNSNAYALVAKCKDGGTCNDVAAMYKAIVRSSNPQVVCGKLNGLSASPVGPGFGWGSDPRQNLPAGSDTIAKCARVNACLIATDRSTPGDPFLECQKAPTSFKTECASRYPCSEVLACMGK